MPHSLIRMLHNMLWISYTWDAIYMRWITKDAVGFMPLHWQLLCYPLEKHTCLLSHSSIS